MTTDQALESNKTHGQNSSENLNFNQLNESLGHVAISTKFVELIS